METDNKHKYFAFISYTSADAEWAKWLEHELAHYHLPLNIDPSKTKTNHNNDIRENLREVFRDTSRLNAGGDLSEKIKEALRATSNLIVICSPNASDEETHPWVDTEVRYFIEELGRINNVFPFIVEGKTPNDYFPKTLRDLRRQGTDILGGNVMKDGKDAAFVKVVSGMLDVEFDTLWQQYEREKAEEEQRKREERDKLLIMQSRFISEKVHDVNKIDSYLARLLALEVLPKDLSNPDRPLVIEAECAFRTACLYDKTVLRGPSPFQGTEQSYPVIHVAFSPDGRLVATISYDGTWNTVRIWNTENGELLKKKNVYCHSSDANMIAFSPDGKKLASCSDDGSIVILDIATGEEQRVLMDYEINSTNFIFFISYRPDGRQIVSVSSDKHLTIWDLDSSKDRHLDPAYYLVGHTEQPNTAVFSPDGKHIVSAGDDGIMIWDAEKGCLLKKLDETCSNSAIYSSDGKRILALQNGFSEAKVWDAESDTLLNTIHPDEEVYYASFSPDGKLLITIPNNYAEPKVWDTESGKFLWTLNAGKEGKDIYFSSDSKQIALVAGIDVQLLRIDDIAKHVFKNNDWQDDHHEITSAAYSPDGRYIVTSGYNNTLIIDAETGTQIHDLKGDNIIINTSSFSPNGEKIVLHDYENSITIWNIETAIALSMIKEDEMSSITNISFSPDGSKILCSFNTYNKTENTYNIIKTWDIATGKPILDVKNCTDRLNFASFSPDGKRIAVAGEYFNFKEYPGLSYSEPDKGIIVVLDSMTGEITNKINVAKGPVSFVTFSPDGKQILSIANGFASVWEAKSGQHQYTFEHGANIESASYSPDGKYIVSVDDDYHIIICDSITGNIIQIIPTGFNDAHSVQFHPNGKQIIATFEKNTVAVYDFPPLQDLIDQTRERFKDRPLTAEERRMYYLE